MRDFSKPKFNFTSFTDVLFSLLLIYIMIMTLTTVSQQSTPTISANVVYQIVMEWDGKSKDDIDLWVKDPMGRLVAFNNREGGEGSLFSLNRDDLGGSTEVAANGVILPINEELVGLRGHFEGEYIVNGHMYRKVDKEVTKVTCKLVKIKPFKEIVKFERELKINGDEKTFFRFKLDKEGNVTDTNELPQIITKLNSGESEMEGPQQ